MTLQAKDLMVGDWVYLHEPNEEKEVIRIEGVEDTTAPMEEDEIVVYRVGNSDWVADVEDIEPIPITSEILEKWGFTKVNSQRYELGSPEDAGYININPKKGIIHINGKDRSNVNLYGQFYVHELQHALRLCGIDLEIKL